MSKLYCFVRMCLSACRTVKRRLGESAKGTPQTLGCLAHYEYDQLFCSTYLSVLPHVFAERSKTEDQVSLTTSQLLVEQSLTMARLGAPRPALVFR